MTAAGARIGQHWQVNPRAALSLPFDDRPACTYCGQCSRGCPIGDKGSTDVTFLRQAARTGRLTVVTGATVTRLVTGPNGRIARAPNHGRCLHAALRGMGIQSDVGHGLSGSRRAGKRRIVGTGSVDGKTGTRDPSRLRLAKIAASPQSSVRKRLKTARKRSTGETT